MDNLPQRLMELLKEMTFVVAAAVVVVVESRLETQTANRLETEIKDSMRESTHFRFVKHYSYQIHYHYLTILLLIQV